jgi:hypothetical protein
VAITDKIKKRRNPTTKNLSVATINKQKRKLKSAATIKNKAMKSVAIRYNEDKKPLHTKILDYLPTLYSNTRHDR